jgi:hypothetical protein
MSTSTSNHPVGHNTINELAANSNKQAGKNTGEANGPPTMLDTIDHEAIIEELDYHFAQRVLYDQQIYLQKRSNEANKALNEAKRAANVVTKTQLEVAKTQTIIDDLSYSSRKTLSQSSIATLKVTTLHDLKVEIGKYQKICSEPDGQSDSYAEKMLIKSRRQLCKLLNNNIECVVTVSFKDSDQSKILYLTSGMATNGLERVKARLDQND